MPVAQDLQQAERMLHEHVRNLGLAGSEPEMYAPNAKVLYSAIRTRACVLWESESAAK